jgi:hypothetical protein
MKKIFFIGIFLAVFGCVTLASAELIDNKNGLIYDTDRNITWYIPKASDMDWNQAMAWVEGLTVGGVTGWRLPSALNQDGSYPYYGYGAMESELGHLYYEELNNVAGGPFADTVPFTNLRPINYWSSTVTTKFAGNAFIFNFNNGKQGHADKNTVANFSAIAVHPGNIVALDQTADVSIDIRPWSKRNPINYRKGHGLLPVAILSTENFNAQSEIDQDSLTFGATGNEQSLAYCNHRSGNEKREGLTGGLICHFYIEAAGFNCGDTEGILMGKTLSGMAIEGKDLVRITHCK